MASDACISLNCSTPHTLGVFKKAPIIHIGIDLVIIITIFDLAIIVAMSSAIEKTAVGVILAVADTEPVALGTISLGTDDSYK